MHPTDPDPDNMPQVEVSSLSAKETVESLSEQLHLERQKRKRAERKLRKQSRRQRDYAKSTNEFNWEQDAEFRFTSVNAFRECPSLGAKESCIGKTRWDMLGADPNSTPHWKQHLADLQAHKPFKDFRYQLLDENGKTRFLSIAGVPVYNKKGRFRGYRGSVSDVSALIRSRESNDRFLKAIDRISEGIALWGPDERLVMHNDPIRELSGLAGASLFVGMTFEDWIRERLRFGMIPEVSENTEELIAERLESFRNSESTVEILRKGRWYLMGFVKLADGSTVQTLSDITEVKSIQYRFEQATSAIGVGVFEMSPDHQNTDCSESLLKLFGIVDKSTKPSLSFLFSHVVEDQKPQFKVTVNEAVEKKQPFKLECQFKRIDGTKFWARLNASLIGSETTPHWFGTVTDISDQRQADDAKQEFVSTINHELRTPLTAIKGSLDLICSGIYGEIPEKPLKLLNLGRRNSDRLLKLINDILDIEKIDSGHIPIDLAVWQTNDLLSDAKVLNDGFAAGFGVRLVLSQSSPDVKVVADRAITNQIFSNLISNAVKFSPEGGVVDLSVSYENKFAVFAVRDRGKGIPENFRPKIFERFSQADGSDTRKVGGTGLGMSICKALVEKQGGSLTFDSQVGHGTVFRFSVPLQK